VTIPPQYAGLKLAGRKDCEEILTDKSLLINNPKKMVDWLNLKICSQRKFLRQFLVKRPPISPNCGLIIIDEPFRFDSLFGVTNGIPISFDNDLRDEILKFAEENRHLLTGSMFGSELLRICEESNNPDSFW